jgi:hypothetical protein
MINIVMLVKDRPRLTNQCISSVMDHSLTEVTLTIVDSDSQSETRRIIREWVNRVPTSVCSLTLDRSNEIAGQNLNLGAYWSERFWGRGDYLYFSGNDMYFTKGWDYKMIELWTGLDHILRYRDNNIGPLRSIGLMGGSTHPYHGVNETYDLPPFEGAPELRTHDAVAGCSHMMKWETWDSYGPYDAHAPGIQQSEDWKLCNDIVQDGRLVGTIYPNVVYDCGLTTTFGEEALGAEQKLRYEGVIQE